MMAMFVKFKTQVFACYNHTTKEWEYLAAKPDGLVYINPDAVKYVEQTPNGEVTCVLFGPREGDDYVFLHQSIDSVVRALEEASRQ